jgi:glycerol-3-phosphate acyltransferase PlsY
LWQELNKVNNLLHFIASVIIALSKLKILLRRSIIIKTMLYLIPVLLLLCSYLLGSIPTGYLAAKYLKGIDIREYGSGSTGATNILRTVGKRAAAAVLCIDALKGAIAVALVSVCYAFLPNNPVPDSWRPWLVVGTALGAVIGHSKSCWINFSGGKSVATSLGVLLVMNPLVGLGTLASFGISLAISRIVSLSSIVGAISVSVLMALLQQPQPYLIFAVIVGVYVTLRHRTNIQRLLAGTEPKIGQKLQETEAN